ncbi:MAG: sulfotransferase, partial [Bradymonadaceae bacterium]
MNAHRQYQQLRNRTQDMECVFISTPSPRNGSTLLQRLITSSDELLIFGEQPFVWLNLLHALPKFDASSESGNNRGDVFPDTRIQRRDELLQKFVRQSGEVYPQEARPEDASVQHLLETFESLIKTYHTTARQYDFQRWGAKAVWLDDHTLPLLRDLFPRARFLFLFRNIQSVLESLNAQIRRPHHTWNLEGTYEWKIERYYRIWEDQLRWAQQTLQDAPDTRILQTETFLADPKSNLEDLCEFLDIDHIDAGESPFVGW